MQPHGSFELRVNNQVLIAKIIGAWNKETGEQYFCELKKISQHLIQQPWALAVYLTEWELGTPGSDEVTLELIKWLAANNLEKVAEIYSPSILKKMHVQNMINQTEPVFERQYFSDEQAAFAWLESQGFPINAP